MARILLAWELGANTGHVVKLRDIGEELGARGHEVVLAVQDIGAITTRLPVWQAPVWPGQLAALARLAAATPATMGDILATLGLRNVTALTALLGAWDQLFAAIAPDIVLAEFAPAAQLAAWGRIPLLALGSGFSLPPAHLDRFPSLTGAPPVHEEDALLTGLNQALRANGLRGREALPAIFAADRTIVAAFRELDPYREWRDAHGAPSVMPSRTIAAGGSDEIFIYMNGMQDWPSAFWQGIVDARLPVRVHDPRLREADARTLEGAGLIVERERIPFDRIVERSRMVLSHGGLGLACSALLAGLPEIFVPFDIEKGMVAASVVELGVGRSVPLQQIEREPFARLLRDTYEDNALVARSRAAAPGFRARMPRSCAVETADMVDTMPS